MRIIAIAAALALGGLLAAASAEAQTSDTAGSAGSAAAGGTSASSAGTGGTSTAGGRTGSSLATGGSAAGGKINGHSHVSGGGGHLNGQTMEQAHQGGTFSKSHTRTKDKPGGVTSTTKSMSHVPGEKPVKSTSTGSSQ